MPAPTTALTVLRPDLADAFEEFDLMADQEGYIAQRVLPITNVAVQSGQFGIVPIEQLLQNPDTKRAPGSAYSRGDYQFETGTFATQEFGMEEPIDDRERNMYASLIDAELVATRRAINAVLQAAEKRVADLVFNATTWTATTVTNEWDDATNATPIDDVETAVQAVWTASGLWPNTLIINRVVFRNLRMCDQIRDRISSSGAGSSELLGQITTRQLSEAFDLPNILVAGGAKNTGTEGAALSIASIWSNEYAMIARIPTTGDFREPGLGRTFHYTSDGSAGYSETVEQYRDETVRSDIIRYRHDVDEKILHTPAAHLLDNITT